MEETLIILATISPAAAAIGGFFAAAWWSSNRHVKRLEALLRDRRESEPGDDTLTQALGAIEDQLDRMRDEQEFLTRIVAEGKGAAGLPRTSRDEATPA